MPKPPPVEDTLAEAIEQLVLERINGYGECESTAVQAAYRQFDAATAKLKATLSPEQSKLFIDCENAISEVDGETADLVGKAGCAEVFGFFAGVFSNGCDQLLAVGTADVVVDNHNV